jgi:hypothetical protein
MNKKKSQITLEEQEKILDHIVKQNLQIKKQIPLSNYRSIKVECYDCERDIGMINMYRCYQCGLYICGHCAPKHFNVDKSKFPSTIKKGTKIKLNLKQLAKAIDRFNKNKRKILCSLGFHKYECKEYITKIKNNNIKNYSISKCKYCRKELIDENISTT